MTAFPAPWGSLVGLFRGEDPVCKQEDSAPNIACGWPAAFLFGEGTFLRACPIPNSAISVAGWLQVGPSAVSLQCRSFSSEAHTRGDIRGGEVVLHMYPVPKRIRFASSPVRRKMAFGQSQPWTSQGCESTTG